MNQLFRSDKASEKERRLTAISDWLFLEHGLLGFQKFFTLDAKWDSIMLKVEHLLNFRQDIDILVSYGLLEHDKKVLRVQFSKN